MYIGNVICTQLNVHRAKHTCMLTISHTVTKVKKTATEVQQRSSITSDNSCSTIENHHSIDLQNRVPTRNRLDDSLLEGSESDSNYDDIEVLSETDLQGNSSPLVYPKYSTVNKTSKQQQQQQPQTVESFKAFEKRLGAVESHLARNNTEAKMVSNEMEKMRGAMDTMSKQLKVAVVIDFCLSRLLGFVHNDCVKS